MAVSEDDLARGWEEVGRGLVACDECVAGVCFLDRFFWGATGGGFFFIGFKVNTTSNDSEPSGPVEIVPVTHTSSADESSKDDRTPRPTVTPVNCGSTPLLEDALLKVDTLCLVSTGSTR